VIALYRFSRCDSPWVRNVGLNQAMDAINKLARETLPSTITTGAQGSAQAFQQSFNDLGWLLIVSINVFNLLLYGGTYNTIAFEAIYEADGRRNQTLKLKRGLLRRIWYQLTLHGMWKTSLHFSLTLS